MGTFDHSPVPEMEYWLHCFVSVSSWSLAINVAVHDSSKFVASAAFSQFGHGVQVATQSFSVN